MASLKKLGLCNYQSDSEEFVQKMMDWPQIQDKSPFQLYKEAYLVITQDDENAFLRLEKWLYDNHDHVGKDELHIALSYLQNFAAAQFKKAI
ncbi:MAG: hypothetical protein IPN33_24335 [Saprospiraceae bacterium]|nr:hypothetical protein [Saprospiraceae bacterium]